MKTKINVAEILKNKPKGTKLWSPIFGECTFDEISCDNSCFGVDTNKRVPEIFYANGKYDENGECTIFPSKKMRDWSRFAWKKGDLLVHKDGDVHIIFEKFVDDTYCSFVGKYYLWKENNNTEHFYENERLLTSDFQKAGKDAAQTYINTIEERLGGKLNRETLEIEKAQTEFKDGDIVVYECEINDIPSTIFIFRGINQFTPYYSYYACLSSDGFLSYKLSEFGIYNRELRFATEAEKSQLFSALAKAKKVWIPEKKQIVNLNPKVELKPFDKVLIRDFKGQAWQVSLFGYKDANKYYCCNGGCWNQCIPYIGNESLLDTTKDVEG